MIVVDRQQFEPLPKLYWRVHSDVGMSTERAGAGVVTNGDNQFALDVPFREVAKKWVKKLMARRWRGCCIGRGGGGFTKFFPKIEGVPINVPPPVFELRDLKPSSFPNSWKN